MIKGVESKFKIVVLGTRERKGKYDRGWTARQNRQAGAWIMSQGVVIVMANDAVVSISALTARWKVVTSAVISLDL